MKPEILEGLRAELREQMRVRDAANAEIARLQPALEALEGGTKPTPAARGPTVPDMVLECCRDFARRHTTAGLKLVLTNANIVETAQQLFPSSVKKIKAGLCGATNKWIAKQKLRRVAGGLELVA